jgi:hypothetical protein
MGLGFFIALLVGLMLLFAGAAILRAAVGAANKTLGPVKSEEPIGWDWDAEEEEEDDFPQGGTPAIPEPGIGQGMFVIFLSALAKVALLLILGMAVDLDDPFDIDDWGDLIAHVLAFLGGAVVMASMLANTLATKWRWAALAVLYFYCILVVIAVFVVVLILVVAGA